MLKRLAACGLLVVLAALALAGTGAAASGASPIAGIALVDQTALFVPNWLGMASAALMLAVGIIAIVFMLGEAFNLPSVKSFARQEVYELAVSVIVVLLTIGALMAFGIFAKNVAGSALLPNGPVVSGFCGDSVHIYPISDRNPENALFADVDWFLGCMPTSSQGKYEKLESGVDLAYDPNAPSHYLAAKWPDGASKGIMAGHLMNIYVSLFSLEFILGPISTFGVSAYLPEPLVSSISLDFAPHAALSPISEAMITVTDLIGVGVGTAIMQKTLLQFVHQNALVIFLPLGLAFRAIPFLRKTGSTLVAIALVTYFVFPLSIWINQQVYFALQDPAHPVMDDWANYHTILQACLPRTGETPAQAAARVQSAIAEPYLQDSQAAERTLRENIYAQAKDSQGNPVTVRLPIAQQNALWEAFKSNAKLAFVDYLLHWGFIAGPTLPVDYFYSTLVDQITVSAQWFMLNLLFLVNTLIITITLFRDISLAIGGEARIFGLSKLV